MGVENYIPAGTLVIEHRTSPDWVSIDHNNIDVLSPKTSIAPLIKAGWAQGFVRNHNLDQYSSTIRVYILPEDVGRRVIERSDPNLRRGLQQVLSSLDVTLEAWEGTKPTAATVTGYKTYSEDDSSLFYLFNTVPSPDPESLTVNCPTSQDAIDSLFQPEGLPNLKSALYPYQKRTSATMVRREVSPEMTVDPRLSAISGPLGHKFYYDSIVGQIFLNPRKYDEVKGGVLAESMGGISSLRWLWMFADL